MHTPEQLTAMKRTDLQRLAAETCGRDAYRWTGPARNAELIQAIQTGETPERFRSGNGGDLATAIAAAIGPLVQGQLDEDRVNALIDANVSDLGAFVEGKVAELARANTVQFEVKLPSGEIKAVGTQHRQFPQLVSYLGLRLNVYLAGDAGSGKTTAAEKAADALGLKFYGQSLGPQTTASAIFGFMAANANFVPGFLYRPMVDGGVVLLDEIDRANEAILTALNSTLANGFCLFPNGELVKAHADFIVIAAGNTFGFGASSDFHTARKQDRALLSRFVRIAWDYDEDFERSLVPQEFHSWVQYVQRIRRVAVQHGIPSLRLTPRTSIYGARLLAAGRPRPEVEDATIWTGIPEDDRAKVQQHLQRAA